MKYTNLAVEFLVIGFVFSLSSLFGYMILIDDYSLDDLLKFFDSLKAQWFFIIAFFFYINGLIIHRSLALMNYEVVKKFIQHKLVRFFLRRKFVDKVEGIDVSKDHWEKYFRIHHEASSGVIDKINFYEKKLVIYKALSFLLPVLALVSGVWIYRAVGIKYSMIISLPCAIFATLSVMSYFLLKHVYVHFISYLDKHLETERK